MTFFGGSNPVGQGTTPAVASVNGATGVVVLDIPTDAEITALATAAATALQQANTSLGALSPAVNAVVTDAINTYNITVQPKIDTSIATANTVSLDGLTFTTPQAVATYIRGLITGGTAVPSAPVPNVAPSVTFTGGSGDVGETATITPGTYSSGTVTNKSWNVIVNGVIVSNTSLPLFVIPASAGTGARSLQITELYSWSGGTGQTGKSSVVYTVNAPAAVPVASTLPGPIVITTNIASAAHGLYSNTPTSYTQRWLDSLGAVLGTSTTLDVSALGGRTITFEETAINAAGSSVANTSLPTTIAGGTAPTYTGTGAVEPGFVAGTFAVGTALVIDFGVALNSPQGYDVQIYRNGVAAVNTGPAASNVTSFSYTPINIDSDQTLSATVVPRNAAGVGAAVLIAGVLINPAVSSASGTISFVAASALGSSSASATRLADPAGGARRPRT
jgi:hypothetical protein